MARQTRKGSGKKTSKQVETLVHDGASRKNIPTAEYQSLVSEDVATPIRLAYERRNRDLDPQLVWRGKDEQDWSDLVVHAPPLYIQEKIHPKVLIDDLMRQTQRAEAAAPGAQIDLFADFNGLPAEARSTDFYQHEANWSNRMILGDSLQVMASLAEREGLRGKVQCIYMDPPYGIKFNSNFQWSTTSRDVKDGKTDHITREPEQVKAFRDTWRDGIHSYLTYLRDRLTAARDLLSDSGSIFVQIGDENVHKVRDVMDEIFGADNFCAQIVFRKTTGKGSGLLDTTVDFLLWFARNKPETKFRPVFEARVPSEEVNLRFVELPDRRRRPMSKDEITGNSPLPGGARIYRPNPLTSARVAHGSDLRTYSYHGRVFTPGAGTFKTNLSGMARLEKADRLLPIGKSLNYLRYFEDFPAKPFNDVWEDTRTGGFGDDRLYVVQTVAKVISRCILMTTDPGDLVLDPTCGSGTTAAAAEQWGRRWITIDTSRVALALARARLMGSRYPYYLLADSEDGQRKEAELSGTLPDSRPTHGSIRHGFVYERVSHITLKSIANNAEIDVIWVKWQDTLEPLRTKLNAALGKSWEEWEIPRDPDSSWPIAVRELHAAWWEARNGRQLEIDASIAANAEFEYLYDLPYEDRSKVRVAGPFTVESVAPHRELTVDEDDELVDDLAQAKLRYQESQDFGAMVLEHLRTSGIQQSKKEDRIEFSSLAPWPGTFISAEGHYRIGAEDTERRAAIFIGPEFGTVSRADLVEAAREGADAGFDSLIACAFSYGAHASELQRLGRLPIYQARMNADLHMADDLKNTGKGNLFVIFGEPDIEIIPADGDQIRVRIRGVDVFDPSTGEVRSDDIDGIACWFIDTDYNQESFFVRHSYFLGAGDPYKSLKTTLKTEIDADAWASLNSDTSRPFLKPAGGRIAIKVINHLGDEVMKVFRV